jgi:glycosyltransferase involved in cell wall biosynthesis
MKILIINKFLYPKGGDALSALATGNLLSAKGHAVTFWGMRHPLNTKYSYENYFIDNVNFDNPGSLGKQVKLALNILYSFEARDKINRLIKKERPDIVHLHNIAHQISPSILHIFRRNNIPIVMTLHDYKLVCASYQMLKNDKMCDACKGAKFYWCFLKSCVKDSVTKSLLATLEMYLHHKLLRIYGLVDIFISPSLFLKNKIYEMGFRGKIMHLSNFLDLNDYSNRPRYAWQDNHIIYFGRLSKEKGLFTLIEAVKDIKEIKLSIIGDGPLKNKLEQDVTVKKINNVFFLGFKSGCELRDLIERCLFVVLPSQWHENNPRAIIESFALGKTVLGSKMGGIPELIINGKTGLTFESGNASDLKEKILYLIKNPDLIVEMGKNARGFAEENFNEERHYKGLMEIYKMALDKA